MRKIPSFLALRAFESAGRLGSFRRASEELHLTPSAISHQIRALERHFGRALFWRDKRQVSLTADGARLLAQLSRAFDGIEAACSELSPPEGTTSLAVHCAPSFAAKWLGPRLPGFIAAHPDLAIRMSSGAERFELMDHEEVDVAITYGAAPRRTGLVAKSLGEEEITALCTPDLAARNATQAPVTLLESTVSPVSWREWFAANGLPMTRTQRGPSFDRGALVIAATVQGLGLALESVRFAEPELRSGELVRWGGEDVRGIRRPLHFLCYREAERDAPKIREFRGWLLAEIAEDARPQDRPQDRTPAVARSLR